MFRTLKLGFINKHNKGVGMNQPTQTNKQNKPNPTNQPEFKDKPFQSPQSKMHTKEKPFGMDKSQPEGKGKGSSSKEEGCCPTHK